jgi:large subunit ribosomal protein L15
MNLTNLIKITTKSKKRVGTGHGSGRGKTSGRGTKGQLARHDSKLGFDGDANPLIRRLPFLRGKGRNRSLQVKPLIVNVNSLNVFSDNDIIDIENLAKHNLVKLKEAKLQGVKILGDGEIEKKLTVKLPVSKNALKKIEKAGGTISPELTS